MAHQEQHQQWADSDDLRTAFALAMSTMYKNEVPLYQTLVDIVQRVNKEAQIDTMDSRVVAMRFGDSHQPRIDIERHGAIRVGTAHELATIAKVFKLLGLSAVGYYDLSIAGLPMHATCFRPVSREALQKNPFRIFTSVLRPDLIKDRDTRKMTEEILGRRNMFSSDLSSLLERAASQDYRLTVQQGQSFIEEALKIFKWQDTAVTTSEEYERLKAQHPILADIACFATSHINHLTPRTLDINAAQKAMEGEGLRVKDWIEGPPPRTCPILLRQTSFLAVEEQIKFPTHLGKRSLESSNSGVVGSHRARFGEIEERGAAVTKTGRKLYDDLTIKARTTAERRRQDSLPNGQNCAKKEYNDILGRAFQEYPDTWQTLRRQKLVYYTYVVRDDRAIEKGGGSRSSASDGTIHEWPQASLNTLIEEGVIEAVPITYEDFLPLSAAGIFQSNLNASGAGRDEDGEMNSMGDSRGDQLGLEAALGSALLDSDELYRDMEQRSIQDCSSQLRYRIVQ